MALFGTPAPLENPAQSAVYAALEMIEMVELFDEQQAALACSFSSNDHPDVVPGYPFPFRMETTHRLDESGLTLDVRVVNEGENEMPFGFGAHPYFRVPFSSGGRREKCVIVIPASRRWTLARLGELSPDAKVSRDELVESVSKGLDLRQPTELGDHEFDDALTDLELSTQAWIECSVTDPTAGLTAVMRATGNFETVVLYTPPNRPGLCFEPWTCPPNALNLVARGVEDTGLVVLGPHKRWEATMRLFLNPA